MIHIRKILPSDFEKASEMIQDTLRKSSPDIDSEELIEEFCKKYSPEKLKIKSQEIEYFVADDNENIIGIIGLKENQLRSFYVSPEKQGQGVGSKLYKYIENEAKMRGIEKMFVEGSSIGEPIYKHFGYSLIRYIEKERLGIVYKDALMEKYL